MSIGPATGEPGADGKDPASKGVDPVEGALAEALSVAAAHGDVDAIKAIVREFEARRLAGSNVTSIEGARRRKGRAL